MPLAHSCELAVAARVEAMALLGAPSITVGTGGNQAPIATR